MLPEKKEHPKEKTRLHSRNRHRERYDFKLLINSCEELRQFVTPNIYNDDSIDFFNPDAVKTLNKALLKQYYQIENWNIPAGYLCPPIPGRADYIHYIADLLCGNNYGKIPTGNKIKCLDIGVGANCVYPIIGNKEYGWLFVGSDIDLVAVESANAIINHNPHLKNQIEIRLQKKSTSTFQGIINKDEKFDVTICNPPFHASENDAKAGTSRKLSNLKKQEVVDTTLNFGGKNNELWCEGGEVKFVSEMIRQSKQYATSCLWFTSLISKQTHLKPIYHELENMGAVEIKTIPMGQGNKTSRIVAWTFLNREEQKKWASEKWNNELAIK